MIVSPVADVLTVTWSISDMERHLHAIVSPFKAKCLVKTTLNVFWEVTTSSCWLLVDISLNEVDVAGKICHVEALFAILYIPVGDKGDVNRETSIGVSNMINDFTECVLGTLDPGVH